MLLQNIVRDLLLAACSSATACSIPDACRLLDTAYSDCVLLDGNLNVPLQVFAHDWEAVAANKSGKHMHMLQTSAGEHALTSDDAAGLHLPSSSKEAGQQRISRETCQQDPENTGSFEGFQL